MKKNITNNSTNTSKQYDESFVGFQEKYAQHIQNEIFEKIKEIFEEKQNNNFIEDAVIDGGYKKDLEELEIRLKCKLRSNSDDRVLNEHCINKTGIERITKERYRQISEEGFDKEHDANEKFNNLIKAVLYYTEASVFAYEYGDKNPEYVVDLMKQQELFKNTFPFEWNKKWCKPSAEPIRNLEKAGALIAAAIDKIINEQKHENQPN